MVIFINKWYTEQGKKVVQTLFDNKKYVFSIKIYRVMFWQWFFVKLNGILFGTMKEF